jgi:hypothetical protein
VARTDLIIAVFCLVDDQLGPVPKHPQARWWPSEVVTIGLLYALKGGSFRSFYRWLARDHATLFGGLPERTRLLRLLQTHHHWTTCCLAAPTFFTVIDTYGIELLHPWRAGRSLRQVGRKGFSNHRWIVGLKLCRLKYLWHRTRPYLAMHLAYVAALFNVLLALTRHLDPDQPPSAWPHIAQFAR